MHGQDSSPELSEETSLFFTKLPGELRNAIYDLCVEDERELPSQNGLEIRLIKSPYQNLQLVSRKFKDEYLSRARKTSTLTICDNHLFGFQTVRFPDIMLFHELLQDLSTLPDGKRPSQALLTELNYRQGMAIVENIRSLEFTLVVECQKAVHTRVNPAPGRIGCVAEISSHLQWIKNFTETPLSEYLLQPGMAMCDIPNSPRLPNLRSVKLEFLLEPHERVMDCENVLFEMQSEFINLKNMHRIDVYRCPFVQRVERPIFTPHGGMMPFNPPALAPPVLTVNNAIAAALAVPAGVRDPHDDSWQLNQKKTKVMEWLRPDKSWEDKGLQRLKVDTEEKKEEESEQENEDDERDSVIEAGTEEIDASVD